MAIFMFKVTYLPTNWLTKLSNTSYDHIDFLPHNLLRVFLVSTGLIYEHLLTPFVNIFDEFWSIYYVSKRVNDTEKGLRFVTPVASLLFD